MKRARILGSILFGFSLLLNACTVIDFLNPTPANVESGTLLAQDDFSTTPNGWGTMGREGGEIGFEYEGLTINVNVPNFMFWTANGDQYRDTRVEVDAVLLEGPTNDHFGVLCRFQDNQNFYAFVISHDGYYGIFKVTEGVIDMGTGISNLEYSEAIRQGGVVNHISAVCAGDRLSLTVNETLLAEVQDSSFKEGQVGLIAGAYSQAGVRVLFDNLEIYQP